MNKRLAALESRVGALERALAKLQARLSEEAHPEPGNGPAPAPPPSAAAAPALPAPLAGSLLASLTAAGRSCLVLGGAFLLRSFTEAGTLPGRVGVLLGLLYALVWLVAADRSAARDRRLGAVFHGLTAALIAYPLVWEATARLAVLSPAAAAALGGLCTAGLLAVAARGDLPVLAWCGVLASLASSALLVPTGAVLPFALLSLVLFLAAGTPGASRLWPGLVWPAALGADLFVWLALTLASRAGGPPEPYAPLPPGAGLGLAGALLLASVGGGLFRVLARREEATPLDFLQIPAAILLGFYASAGLARGLGPAAALLLALATYGTGLRASGSVRTSLLYTTVGLGLTIWGGSLLLLGNARAAVWEALALVLAAAGGRAGRPLLGVHAVACLGLGAEASGFLAAARRAFLGQAGPDPLSAATLAAPTAAAVACLLLSRGEPARGVRRATVLTLGLFATAGAGLVGVRLLAGPSAGPHGLALARTAVLSAAALAVAALRRTGRLVFLADLGYPLLVLGGVKLVLEDLPNGRPATLFGAFILYGVALLGVPRLLRRRAASVPVV